MSHRITLEEAEKKLKETHHGNIIMKNYIYGDAKADFECLICGNKWSTIARSTINGCGCKKCKDTKSIENQKLSLEEVKKRIYEVHGDSISMLDYSGASHSATFSCKNGHQWITSPKQVYGGTGCPFCYHIKSAKTQTFTFEYVKEYIESQGCELVSTEYFNARDKIDILFPCGHVNNMAFDTFKNSGIRCSCNSKKRALVKVSANTKDKILTALDNLGFEFISYDDENQFSWDSIITYKCDKGHIVTGSVKTVMRYGACKECSQEANQSRIATFMKKYCIDKFGKDDIILEYKIIKNPKTGRWLKSDIFIISLSLVIEINGRHHYEYIDAFHKSNDRFLMQQIRDKLKKDWAIENANYLEIDLRSITSKDQAISLLNEKIKEIT